VLSDRLATAGRSSDNDIAFVDDSNVSRYHVEIEPRDAEYWVIDLNSSNGTTVNGEKLTGERLLKDGDKIVLGGSAEMEFTTAEASGVRADAASAGAAGGAVSAAPKPKKKTAKAKSDDSSASSGGIETEAAAASGGTKNLLIIAGILCCVALLCVVGGAAAFYFSRKSGCKATAEITKPEIHERVRCLGRVALAPALGTEPVAELRAAIARVTAQADAADQQVRRLALGDRERQAATLPPPREPADDPPRRERDRIGRWHRDQVAGDPLVTGPLRDRARIVEAKLAQGEALRDDQRRPGADLGKHYCGGREPLNSWYVRQPETAAQSLLPFVAGV